MKLEQSRNIHDYKSILENLVEDFGYSYYHSILCWCRIIENEPGDERIFWQVYLIKHRNKTIGMCGLYADEESKGMSELWLGWFAILPEYRGKQFGVKSLQEMEEIAKRAGCKKILSYVDQSGGPLPFYYSNGYNLYGSVKQFVKNNPLSAQQFESTNDYVIYKNLTGV